MNLPLNSRQYGQGVPVVFIHGWGLNSAVWQPIIEQLQDHIQITTIDLPGFGLNIEHAMSPYTLTNVVDELQAVIAQPSVIVGWSLGGLVATDIALRYPDKVKGLVTVASSPCFVAKDEDENSSNFWAGIQPNVLKMFHQQLAQDTKKTIDGFLKIQAMGSPHVRQDIKTIRDLIMQYDLPTVATLDESLALLETVDLRAELSQISVPSLRIYGKLDSLVPKNAIEDIGALMPKSEEYVFDKASHAPFISHSDEFTHVLLQWLEANST